AAGEKPEGRWLRNRATLAACSRYRRIFGSERGSEREHHITRRRIRGDRTVLDDEHGALVQERIVRSVARNRAVCRPVRSRTDNLLRRSRRGSDPIGTDDAENQSAVEAAKRPTGRTGSIVRDISVLVDGD